MPLHRQIKSVEELYQLSLKDAKVYSPHFPHLEQARKAEQILGMSTRAVLKMIEKGLFTESPNDEIELMEPTSVEIAKINIENFLKMAQKKIINTGLSQSQIGARLGVTQQAVHNFLTAESVQTRILSKYMHALDLTLD